MSDKFKKMLYEALGEQYCWGISGSGNTKLDKPIIEYVTGLEARVAELELRQRWIPVSERLPEEFTLVLTICKNELIISAIIDQGNWYSSFECTLDVTHWMPLPTPPEGYEQ